MHTNSEARSNAARQRVFCCLTLVYAVVASAAVAQPGGYTGPNVEVTEGPDITVWNIASAMSYGPVGSIRAYSVGTDSCNIGSVDAKWCDVANQANCMAQPGWDIADHPVISQNLYRLRTNGENGAFRQIGQGWLKHGFNSTNTTRSDCRGNIGGVPQSCPSTPGGASLVVGCTDFYSAGTNAAQSMAPRSEMISAAGGDFPTNYTQPGGGGFSAIEGRMQAEEVDIDPSEAANVGADYWVEAHYLTEDDATFAGYGTGDERNGRNGLNNASYRRVTFSGGFTLTVDGSTPTQREAPAIYAWKAQDPEVEIIEFDLDTTPTQRFHIAYKVTDLPVRSGAPLVHTEVVVHNMNSDRSARALEIQFPADSTISSQGFHDVDSHSGEPYSVTDWAMPVVANTVRWETETHATNINANALRWGTAYTFWFDSTQDPRDASWTLELFTPGTPQQVTIPIGNVLFADNFESGTTAAWTSVTP